MKIIYYSPHPHLNLMSPAGFGTHMREMITAFEKEGFEILPVILGGIDNPPAEKLNQSNAGTKEFLKRLLSKKTWRTLKDINLIRHDYFTAGNQLEDAIKRFNRDIIYERSYYLQISGIRKAKKYNLPHVMEINSPYVEQNNYLGKSRSYLEKYARNIENKQLIGTNLPLAMVGPLREYFCKLYDIKSDKFLITHDAFNKSNIQLNADNQQKIEARYQLDGQTVIGFIGSIFEWHGLDKLIKAFDELNLANAKLLIVGYGEYMIKLINLVEQLNRQKDVIFTGRVPKDEVFDYISLMDICAAPNAAWYQSPIKIFEYGAMGKPIIGPNTVAVREVMQPDKDGVLVNPSVEEIKKSLVYLLDNTKEASEMGQNFQSKVFNDYTWENNARKVVKELRKRGLIK